MQWIASVFLIIVAATTTVCSFRTIKSKWIVRQSTGSSQDSLHMVRGLKDEEFHNLISGKTHSLRDLTIPITKKKTQRESASDVQSTEAILTNKSELESDNKDTNVEGKSTKTKKRKLTATEKLAKETESYRGVPFTRLVNIADIPANKAVLCRINAKSAERLFVADQLQVIGLEKLAANITLSWIEGGAAAQEGILVTGTIRARMTDPFATLLAEATKNEQNSGKSDDDDDSDNSDAGKHTPIALDFSEDDGNISLIQTKFESRLLYNPYGNNNQNNKSKGNSKKKSSSEDIQDDGTTNSKKSNKKGNASNRSRSKHALAEDFVLDFNELEDYDDEIPASGDIDLGAIIIQYLGLETGW